MKQTEKLEKIRPHVHAGLHGMAGGIGELIGAINKNKINGNV
jgi:hypothetical protein